MDNVKAARAQFASDLQLMRFPWNSNADGDSNYVRVQVLTPVGVLDREKQLGVVPELTDIVAAVARAR
jgi:hypothetical protein